MCSGEAPDLQSGTERTANAEFIVGRAASCITIPRANRMENI
jgi:hypothetical protein